MAPIVTLTGPATVDEGETHTYSYTVVDPGADTFVLDDESCGANATLSNATFNPATGAGSFDCTFPDGPETTEVSVTLSDDDGGADDDGLTVEILNVAPTLNSKLALVTILEGEVARNAGGYDDAGVDEVTLSVSVGTLTDRGVVSSNGNTYWAWTYASTDGPDNCRR